MTIARHRPGEQIAAEVIDGEAVIINLATGIYYSLDGAGGQVWALLAAGHDAASVSRAVAAACGIASDVVQPDVEALLAELVAEGLLEQRADAAAPEADVRATIDGGYRTPKLVVYRDMGDLLALDPPAPGLADIAWKKRGE